MKTRVFSALILCALGFGLTACTDLIDLAFKDDGANITITTTTTTIGLTVEAGDAQIVHSGTVTLNGSANDPNSNDMTYLWAVAAGNPAAVTLNDADTTNASFTVPSVAGVYNFTLYVTAGEVLKSDSVTISVTNAAPTADAGTNEWAVSTSDPVSFTGIGSDPEGDGLTYAWTQKAVNPSVLTLTGDDTDTVSFAQTDTVGVYTLTLTVTDSYGASVSDEVSVSVLEKKIIASDGAADDRFGIFVSLSADGKTALISAHLDDDDGGNSGAAYIYKWDGTDWNETKLTASDGAAEDLFGISVSISADGETALIGAAYDDDDGGNSGAAYIYKWNGTDWNETKLTASDGAGDDLFGISVSISADGETVAVGSRFDDDNGSQSGSAYIYKWDGTDWNETKLTASDGAADDCFGKSVAVSADGQTALIGAYGDDDNGSSSGSAYIYKWNGSVWNETKVTASDGAADDLFSYYSVSLSSEGTTALIGAYYDDDNGDSSGSAYIYQWDETDWVETKLTAGDSAANDRYGHSVSLSSDGLTAIIGAYGDDDNGDSGGSAYIYKWNGSVWNETKVTANDGAANDWFGISVSLSGDGSTAIVGACYDDDNGSSSGSAYIFSVDAAMSMP